MRKANLLLVLALLLIIPSVNAVDYTWTNVGTTHTWADNNNWDVGGSYPDDGSDKAIFNVGSTDYCDINQSITVGNVDIQAGYTGTINQSADGGAAFNNVILGATGNGIFLMSDVQAIWDTNGQTFTADNTTNIDKGLFIGGDAAISFGDLRLGSEGNYSATTGITTLTTDSNSNQVLELVDGGRLFHNDGTFNFAMAASKILKGNFSGDNALYNVTISTTKRINVDSSIWMTLEIQNDFTGSGQIRSINNGWRLLLGTAGYASQVSVASIQGGQQPHIYFEAVSEDYPANISTSNPHFLFHDGTLSADNTHIKWLDINTDVVQSGGSKEVTLEGDCWFDAFRMHDSNTFNFSDHTAEFAGELNLSGYVTGEQYLINVTTSDNITLIDDMNINNLSISGGNNVSINGTAYINDTLWLDGDINISAGAVLTACSLNGTGTNIGDGTLATFCAPQQISPVNELLNDTSVNFTWTNVSTATNYLLQVYNQAGSLIVNVWTSALSYVTTLAQGVYTWEIFANVSGTNTDSSGNASFKVDTTFPTITYYTPTELSVSTYVKNITMNVDVNDSNLFGTNATIWNSSDQQEWIEEYTNLAANYTWDNTTHELSPDNYTMEVCGSDDHTKKKLPLHATVNNINKGYKYKIEKDNNIEVYLSSNHITESIKNTKKSDRFVQEYILEAGENCADGCSFIYKSDKPYYIRENSEYNAHFVSGTTWVDFEADFYDSKGKQIYDAEYEIREISYRKAEITITSKASKIVFKSIGGVNIDCDQAIFIINDPPTITTPNIYDGATNYTNEDLTCNWTVTDNDTLQTLTANITFYQNETEIEWNTTTCTTGNPCTQILPDSFTFKGSSYNCSVWINDGYENSSTKTSENITILNSPPTTPTLTSPTGCENVFNNSNVSFFWSVSTDIDESEVITYDIEIYNESNTVLVLNSSYNISDNNYSVNFNVDQLGYNRNYYWKVNAYDGESNSSNSTVECFKYWEAGGFCNYTSVTIDKPLSKNYTHSIRIPFEFAQSGGDNCWYTINEGIENWTVNCNNTQKILFDVDYDGEYILEFYNEHLATGGYCSANVTFAVDRTSDFEAGKPTMYSLFIFVMLALGALLLFISTKYNEEKYQVFKGLLLIVSYLSIMIGIILINFGVREYIKLPIIVETINYFYMAMISFLMIAFIWTVIIILKKIVDDISKKHAGRKFEE